MQEHGLKISELVTLFNLEVLNRGSDYDTALLTITDVNRPGLQFHSFYDYFDPRRLQVLGKAEITYLKGLTTEQRRKCFDDLFLYDIPALVISRGWTASRSAWRAPGSTSGRYCGPRRPPWSSPATPSSI
ncbi:MAG: hypothetical protein ACLTAZ_08905 [Dysosmobacter welbionis]|uniref:hypothetical protein n=1 Tax=Dysosmobacter welbionis TaxID=2093857 RepID=UPI003991214E